VLLSIFQNDSHCSFFIKTFNTCLKASHSLAATRQCCQLTHFVIHKNDCLEFTAVCYIVHVYIAVYNFVPFCMDGNANESLFRIIYSCFYIISYF